MHYMPFGKHKGTPLSDLPNSYVIWLLDQDWLKPEMRIELGRCGQFRGDRIAGEGTEETVFTQNELKWMLKRCHPDLHDGSDIAQTVTQKLNASRKS